MLCVLLQLKLSFAHLTRLVPFLHPPGRYVRDHKRLDVLGTGRYLSNMFLNSLLEMETSEEDEEDEEERES